MTLAVEAFAKVNLSLRVLGRRPDGFHELDTVFQTVELSDRLSFEEASGLSLEVTDPAVPVSENLVLRAAEALRAATGARRGAAIHLEKRIPQAGGLGGGSADAAVTLVALCRLWDLDPGAGRLQEIAASLGSDVPFFLHGGTARGTGRGERIEPLEDAPARGVLLVMPPFGARTPDVFRALGAPGLTGASPLLNLEARGELGDRNDLESAAEGLFPVLAALRRAVEETGALRARLSGSGSTLYGLYPDRETARLAATRLGPLPEGTRVVPTSTVPRATYRVRALGGAFSS